MKLTLGSDPELVLINRNNELPVSAIPLFRGTKHKPEVLENGILSHDNVNVEFGIKPADTPQQWVNRTRAMLEEIARRLPPNVRMASIASSEFPKEELELEEARVFGCDPDFDPYTFQINEVPQGAEKRPLRSCGGHIHVGHEHLTSSIEETAMGAKLMDVFVGVPSLLLDKDPTSARRRNLYGKAGCHRPKPYGVEYRAVGNFWLSHPSLTLLVYHLTKEGLASYLDGHLNAINWEQIRSVINNGDTETAKQIVDGFVLPLLKERTQKLFEVCLSLPLTDIYEGWNIQ